MIGGSVHANGFWLNFCDVNGYADLRTVPRPASRRSGRWSLLLKEALALRTAEAEPEPIFVDKARSGLVGLAGTLGCVPLCAVLRPVAAPQRATTWALQICTLANAAANRGLTFGLRDSGASLRNQMKSRASPVDSDVRHGIATRHVSLDSNVRDGLLCMCKIALTYSATETRPRVRKEGRPGRTSTARSSW